jgi:glycosyltransferase involved in cell wall biosynthesis
MARAEPGGAMTVRVLHVYKHFRPRLTGEGVFLERMAPLLRRLRPDVAHEVLVTSTPGPPLPARLPGLDAVHYLSQNETCAPQREIVRWLRDHGDRYAVVHHHTQAGRTLVSAIRLKLKRRRVVLSAMLEDSPGGLPHARAPRLFGLVDAIVAASPKLHAQNVRLAGTPKAQLVPRGVPIPSLEPAGRIAARMKLGLSQSARILVSVGPVCPNKDQMFLVQRMPELVARDPRLQLVIVGPTPDVAYQTALEQFVAEHRLHQHVVFVGHVEQPWDFYRAADAMVYASRQESVGTAVIEAMSFALPVIARWLPGVKDAFVEHGRSGYLFRQGDEYHFQVSRLTTDPLLARRMGEVGRAFVSSHHRIEDVAARYLEIYGFPAASSDQCAA